jgi:uncharacterized membrane protein
MKKLSLITFAILLVATASATNINSHNVTLDLASSKVNVTMDIEEMSSSEFYYTSTFPVTGQFSATADREPLNCEREPLPPGTYITCETDKKNMTMDMSYSTKGLVTEREKINIFRYSQPIQRPTDLYNLKVLLPSGTGLADGSNVSLPVLSPDTGSSETDGQRIYVTWTKNPNLGQLDFQAVFQGSQDPKTKDKDVKSNNKDLRWLIPLLVLFLIIAGVIVLLKSREDIDSVYENLTEDEAEVLDMVRENENSMLQKDVVDESEYSKAKISSVISGLEEKGIVKKSKEGRSNKISISRKYRF